MPHVHNALHKFTAIQAAYRKAVGEPTPEFSGIERAGETLTPILDLFAVSRPELAALRGEILFNYFTSVTAVVGELPFGGIRNPTGSRMICVVDRGIVSRSTAGLVQLNHGAVVNTDVDGSEQVAPADSRFNLAGITQIVGIHGTGAAAVGNDALVSFRAPDIGQTVAQELVRGLPQILTPGFELRFYSLAANTSLEVWLSGYTRPALAGELE